ncbi:MAG: hypothetical protein ACK55R_13130 [Cyanobacteriota bacterium]
MVIQLQSFHQMGIFRRSALAMGLAVGMNTLTPQATNAGAVIFNNIDSDSATVALGVNDQGHLNFEDLIFQTSNAGPTGLAYRFPDGFWRDATAPGCLCEGWGVALTDPFAGRVAGWVNRDSGNGGLLGGTFGSTGISASSLVQLAESQVSVQHLYGISLAPHVFQGNVTITNNGTSTISDLVYRRVMDWDVPPTEFNEFVTHSGVASHLEALGGNVRFASDNGFATSDPRVPAGSILGGTTNVDFDKSGPTDHGSVFDFAFGNLAPGESRTFNIFYGAAGNRAEALNAVATISPDVYSLGQSTLNSGGGGGGGGEGETLAAVTDVIAADAANDDAPTFLFAFKGVGGVEVGLTQDNPILPFVPAPGQFEFPAPTPRRWFDPPFVSRFDYSLDTGEFLSFILPSGFSGLDLVVGGTTFADLVSDGVTEYFFAGDFGLTDVTEFTIADISPSVDAADPTAFPTFLDFTPGATGLTMQARIDPPPPGTSVPGPLSVLGCGAAFGFSRRLRQRIKLSKLSVD